MRVLLVATLMSVPLFAQRPTDPFPTPISSTEGVIQVSFVEFASIPDVGGEAARMMLLVDESGTRRMFLNDMRGLLFTVNYDGGEPKTLLDVIQQKNVEQGRSPASRADLRFALGQEGQVFLLNKHDGTIRLLMPDASASR